MNWIETKIYTTSEGVEAVTGLLMQLGINGFVVEDAKDIEDFLNDQAVIWDYVDEALLKLKDCDTNVTIYLPDNLQGRETFISVKNEIAKLKQIDEESKYGKLTIETKDVKEDDWANNWKQYFKPFEVGSKFIIKPSWDDSPKVNDRIILEIDPGSSFGTGQHETTKLCIMQLEKKVNHDFHILDMGCGSGILSLASLLLGAGKVTSVDIDENSTRITRENFEKNHIEKERFNVYCGNVIDNEELQKKIGYYVYDIVVANIVADVIIAMKDIFKKFLKENGTLIVSGIIDERQDEVINALTQSGFSINEVNTMNDWVAITAKL